MNFLLRTQILFFILSILLIVPTYAQYRTVKFRRITSNQGLSQDHVTAILEDRKGYMWFGTEGGLNKYDGYEFTVYKNIPEEESSVGNNYIQDILEDKNGNLLIAVSSGLDIYDRDKDNFRHIDLSAYYPIDLFEDSKGKLWIGTNQGLILYDIESKKLEIYLADDDNKSFSLQNNPITEIAEGKTGELWIATTRGLCKFNPQSKKFTDYAYDPENPKSFRGNYVTTVYKDKKENIWIGTRGNGISLYNDKEDSFVNFSHDPNNKNSLAHKDVLSFEEDEEGNLWIGTENGGISILDIENNQFHTYTTEINDNYSLSNPSIYCIYKDRIGNMWIGTYAGGINFLPKYGDKFIHHKQLPYSSNCLSSSNVLSIGGDFEDNIWIGTDGGGLNFFDRKKKTFTHYRHNQKDENTIKSDYIFSIVELDKDNIVIGYHRAGFDIYNRKTGVFEHHVHNPDDPNGLSEPTVLVAYKDKSGMLWLGTPGGGLNSYNVNTGQFRHYKNNPSDPNSISSNVIPSIFEDSDGNLWVGTQEGLNLFDRKKNKFIRYINDPKNKNSLSHNGIYAIYEDNKKNLWIGTAGGGLNLFNKKTQGFKSFTEKEGLANNSVFGILEDKSGNLWLSTNKGISEYDTKSGKFTNYDVTDGVQGNQFRFNASFKTKDGEMFFGGTNGFNAFYPETIKENPNIPETVFTGFEIFNLPVKLNVKNSSLAKSIDEAETVTLNYDQSVFTFKYSALNYTLPEKNQFAYKMEGFDADWNYVGTQRKATYTNLNPGDYIFRVKASNNDGVWNEEGASVKVIITPPFWKTWWFESLTVLFIVGGFIAFYKVRVSVIKKQKTELEKQVKERTSEISAQKEIVEEQAEFLKDANHNLKEQKEELSIQSEKLQFAVAELNQQKEEINDQRSQIENLYTELKDSIRAAQNIQEAILPSASFIEKHLPENFILYLPKDVVSGDFYWYDVIDEKIVIAVGDCTGHGVSGAMTSINAYHFLNQAIYNNKELNPSQILNTLNDNFKKGIQKDGVDEQIDGMDISICILDKMKGKLEYAGAKSPLYIVREKELIQIKPNRFSIGIDVPGVTNHFTNNIIDLQQGDVFYVFSDGYADQLNQKGDKFMYNRFRDLLLEISDKKMSDQMNQLEKCFKQWQGNEEQLDDVLVMGFKVS
ncbi:MAG TPA: two-component regulator propeller domain-containing protein [Cytophagales bacterium]|nr:two-component regulator propeller domain-containing protein [Cytophagales bacterium]